MHECAPGTMSSDTKFDYQCLELIMTFLDHQIPEDDYQNALISALAVLGIREAGGRQDPGEYTLILSAVVKVARMLAISWAYEHRQADVKRMMRAHTACTYGSTQPPAAVSTGTIIES
ncbi:hypothetical protein E4U58_001787, partial [Claviceps cyperi]